MLHALTNKGVNVAVAQQVYGFLYLQSLALACAIYHQAGGIPNWVILLLPLSKRLHSIFVLRLFNDCWALVAAQAATLAFGAGWDFLGLAFYRYAVYRAVQLCFIQVLSVLLFPSRCRSCCISQRSWSFSSKGGACTRRFCLFYSSLPSNCLSAHHFYSTTQGLTSRIPLNSLGRSFTSGPSIGDLSRRKRS